MMAEGVQAGVFPGAVLVVGNRHRILFEHVLGLADRFTREPVSLDTVFDLASLTKPLATTPAVMKLIQANRISLETTLGELFPVLRGSPKQFIRISQLLYHTSGLPAHRHYYRELRKLPLGLRRSVLRDLLVKEPLARPVGETMVYSDLGFMMLCWAIEELTRQRLDHFVVREIFEPLRLQRLFFVDLASPAPDCPFAAAEQCPWRNTLLKGAVSDDNAWVVGGVDGQAGLFGTAGEVYSFLSAMLQAYVEKSEFIGITNRLVRTFLKRDPHSGRALGFDTPAETNSSCGTRFSKNTVGHLGYTGTSFWMDLERELIVVLLTNRVHPDRDNNRIRAFRPKLHEAVMEILAPNAR